MDLSYLIESNSSKLETIAEIPSPSTKKVKESIEIRFCKGKPTLLRLRFKYNPEYMTLGQKVIIYEHKLVGRVKEIFY